MSNRQPVGLVSCETGGLSSARARLASDQRSHCFHLSEIVTDCFWTAADSRVHAAERLTYLGKVQRQRLIRHVPPAGERIAANAGVFHFIREESFNLPFGRCCELDCNFVVQLAAD